MIASYLHNCFTNMALEVKFRVQYQSQVLVFVFRLPFNFSVTKEQVGLFLLAEKQILQFSGIQFHFSLPIP